MVNVHAQVYLTEVLLCRVKRGRWRVREHAAVALRLRRHDRVRHTPRYPGRSAVDAPGSRQPRAAWRRVGGRVWPHRRRKAARGLLPIIILQVLFAGLTAFGGVRFGLWLVTQRSPSVAQSTPRRSCPTHGSGGMPSGFHISRAAYRPMVREERKLCALCARLGDLCVNR
jgi:hypothetical protein